MTLRIANCSGFYGDRLSAAREMVEGGPIDVLTGDWLAELTMLILAGNRLKGRPGYATTFLRQLEDVLGACLDRGIKIVSNAGGLDPAGCAEAVRELAARLGLSPKIAYVTGDDLTGRPLDLVNADTGERLDATPLTANAYLGGRPIAAALAAGADVVVTGRVTDAALVTGPGMWRYGWGPSDLDALAGSVVAGHVIECGCQATGGNYAFFQDVPDLARCGFPIAELRADGSAVITKHPGTGGLVSIGTVTAQLVYEIGGPRYPGPDVVARFDTITLSEDGPDRVLVSGVRGEPPPDTLKVAVNYLAGYRNTMTLVLTGLDVEAKARVAEEAIWARIPRESFDHVDVTLAGGGLLRITVMDADRHKVGRAFSSAVVETGLASYPGFYGLTPPGDASPYGVYWPVLVPAAEVRPRVFMNGDELPLPDDVPRAATVPNPAPARREVTPPAGGPVARVPLGRIAGARSGDKGGNANLGVWADTPDRYGWLASHLTIAKLKDLLPALAPYRIERFELPAIKALNFVVHGLLGRGVAASPRMDPQAKALGEELRAQLTDIPTKLLPDV
ncbi:DUF1446 domain-containing protein [Nonomuraea turkmeniaca]|uniref:DUF1446 domain-containing protein n=1 Tax=Nonomuraea turkmeniaca TaxID=103838 RepID=A0A5S4FI35_9ACTN|nr:DUF1446 domain-containing protein [Nonomuraea turkmeniaca]